MCFMLCNQSALERYKSSSVCYRQHFHLLDLQWMTPLLNFSPPPILLLYSDLNLDLRMQCTREFQIPLDPAVNHSQFFYCLLTMKSIHFHGPLDPSVLLSTNWGESGLQSNPLDKILKITYVWQRLERSYTHRRHHLLCKSECCFQFLLIQFLEELLVNS